MVLLGAHVSAAGSLSKSFSEAKKISAQATQIFISPPLQWAQTPHTEEEILRYKEEAQKTAIGPNFIHAVYLINLASSDESIYHKSISWLIYSQKMAQDLGIKRTIFHIGSSKDQSVNTAISKVIKAIEEILSAGSSAQLIMENSAGSGNLIGDTLDEISKIKKIINNPKLKICLDTQHLFASGYDLSSPKGVYAVINEVGKKIGFPNIAAIHLNDSKVGLGSHRDRHENIGQGLIGITGFKALINHPDLQNIPFILEVPGLNKKGPDQANLDILKNLIII